MTESVSKTREPESKSGMGVFGWLVFLGMVIILVPLLPFILLIKLVDTVFGDGDDS